MFITVNTLPLVLEIGGIDKVGTYTGYILGTDSYAHNLRHSSYVYRHISVTVLLLPDSIYTLNTLHTCCKAR